MPRSPPPPRRRHRRSLQAISEFAAALAVRLIDQPPLHFDGHPAPVLCDAAHGTAIGPTSSTTG